MIFDLKTGLSLILIISGLITLLVSFLIYKRLDSNVKIFCFTMLAIAIWAIGDGLVLFSHTIEEMLFWTRFEYIGISVLPALWIASVVKLIGKDKWLMPASILLIFLIPIITLVLVWTNNSHHLYYSEYFVDRNASFSIMAIQPGPWYHVHIIYFYTMLVLGVILLVSTLKEVDVVYKKQRNIVLVGIVIPWLCNLIYLIGYSPLKYLDITPFTLVSTSLIIGFGLLRYKLFDIVPIARDRVIEEMKEGVLVLDKFNRVIDSNPEMRRILFSQNIDIGTPIKVLFAKNFDLLNLVETQVNQAIEVKLKHKDKEKFFHVSSTSLFENDEVYTGKFLLFKDISELHAKEAIRELMLKKDEFLSIASHELKTPITSMKGYLQIIDKISQRDENDSYKDFITKANKQVDKLVSLIGDLLDVSKIEAGKMQYNFIPFKVKEIIEDCIAFSELNSPAHSIVLKGNIDIQIIGDRNRIEQVICNLLSNAVKYSPHSHKIVMAVITDDDNLKVSVTDYGLGIAKEKQRNLFQKFSRLDNTNPQISGLGIGLFLSHEIINRHDGKIYVESQEGKGSTFCFTLPLYKNVAMELLQRNSSNAN